KHGAEKKLKILVEDRTYELQRETSTLMAIFNSIPDLIFHMDSDLRYVRVNASMEKHFNLQLNDMIGKTDKDLLNIPESVKRSLDEMNKKVLEDKKPMTFEEIVPTFDGKEVIFETTKVPLRLNGQVFGLLGIARDITRRKAMEEEAKAASLSKSTFLANMSHELRTPLNVIIGLTDLTLEEEGLTSSVTTNLINVSNAGRTLLSIVNDILDISKIESGKLSLIPEEYHMSSLLNDTITLFNTYVGEKPIDFKLHISEELPSMLFGDELRVKQILTNLLSNAVKYTPEGTVDLAVTCERDKNDAWLDIIVKDTGIGIRKEDLESLFSDYYQADAQTNRKTEGTGLGLSITRKLSELMDGAVTVESEYGKGSTFRTRLRQGFVDAEPIGVVVAANLRDFSYIDTKRQKSDKLVRVDLTGKRVLVVDDMQNNLDVAAGLMRKYKMHVDCVTNGPAAIDRIRDKTPVYNAVFMDHMMPGMDGIETAVAIRALGTEYALDLPIIALTANAVAGTQQQFFENGFQDFLSKPIDIMRLDAVLKKWLRSRSSEPFQIIPEASEAQEISENEAGIPTDIPGVDTAKGLALYGGNSDIYLSVLRSFAANTHKITAMLRDATPETLSECLVNAHGLKGTAANICAEDLRAKAAELEAAARGGDLEKYSSLSDSVAAEAELLTENLIARLKAFDELNVLPRQNAPDRDVLTRLKESCKIYDMTGIDEALDLLESKSYETGSELVLWLREKIDMAELDEVVARLSEEEL
ncbi:MAG: ATP-binding protein, partial [Oscillospiraceae bacterium]|nr:ATP-binding protein [Oscillospiraceae bacterium]